MRGISQKMFNKKGSLGKKGSIYDVLSVSLVFSLVSIIFIFISLFFWASSNDYLFYPLQNLTESLEADGIVINGTSALTQSWGDDYTNFNLNLDMLWFIAYLTFIISSFVVSYRAERQNYFSFLGFLFYGTMAFLFLLTIFSIITNWFKDEILLSIIPSANIIVPKFYFYLDNIGIFSAIHLAICLFINMVDFDFAKIFQKKKIEEQALMDDEEVI